MNHDHKAPPPDTDGGPNPDYRPHGEDAATPAPREELPFQWTYEPRPPGEVLRRLLDHAELEERQAEERSHREALAKIARTKARGAARRKQIVRSAIMRIGESVPWAGAADALLADFELSMLDDHALGEQPNTGGVVLLMQRPGWADIELVVNFDDGGEANGALTQAVFSVRPRNVMRPHGGEDARPVTYLTRGPFTQHKSFAEACLVAHREGARMFNDIESEKASGREVRII